MELLTGPNTIQLQIGPLINELIPDQHNHVIIDLLCQIFTRKSSKRLGNAVGNEFDIYLPESLHFLITNRKYTDEKPTSIM